MEEQFAYCTTLGELISILGRYDSRFVLSEKDVEYTNDFLIDVTMHTTNSELPWFQCVIYDSVNNLLWNFGNRRNNFVVHELYGVDVLDNTIDYSRRIEYVETHPNNWCFKINCFRRELKQIVIADISEIVIQYVFLQEQLDLSKNIHDMLTEKITRFSTLKTNLFS